MPLLTGECFFLFFQGGENSVAIDLIVRHVRTQLEQVRLSVKSFGCFTLTTRTILSTQNNFLTTFFPI